MTGDSEENPTTSSDRDLLTDTLRTATRAACAGGAIVRRDFDRRVRVQEKRGADLLTEVDLAAEEVILAVLRAAHPEFGVVSEESGVTSAGSPYTWIVDPLDGTNNFVVGIPYVGVSIGLMRGDEALLGVIYQPLIDCLWDARRGAGTRRNGEPMAVNGSADIRRAVIAWVQGYPVTAEQSARYQHALHGHVKRVLTNWAPALDWCLLAEGRIDALISLDSEREDQVAGTLIAQEAGVLVTDLDGGPFTPETTRILAARDSALHDALREILATVE